MDFKKIAGKYWFVAFLIAIFIMAFLVRSVPGRFGEFQGLDEFYLYRISETILNNNLQLPAVDTLRNYPIGDTSFDLYLQLYLPVFVYLLLNPFLQMHFFYFAIMYPALMGALACVVMFFIGKELFKDNRAALLSAFFLATVPAFLTRTTAANFEKESSGMVFLLLSVLFFIKAFKNKSWKYGILAGIMTGLMGLIWGGVQNLYVLYAIFGIILLLINKDIDRNFIASVPTTLLGIFIPFFIQPIRYPLSTTTTTFGLFIVALIIIRFGIERLKLVKHEKLKYVAPGLLIFLVLFLMVGSMFSDFVYSFIDRISFMLSLKQGATQTVAEAAHGSWDLVVSQTGIYPASSISQHLPIIGSILPSISFLFPIFSVWLFFILGSILLVWGIYRTKNTLLFLPLIWIIFSVLATISQIRLVIFVGPSSAIIAGFFVYWFIQRLDRKSIKDRIKISPSTPNPITIILVIFVLFLVLLNYGTAQVHVNGLIPTICNPQAYQNGTIIPCVEMIDGELVYNLNGQPWYQAMDFLRKQTPENSSVLSWWDFGYWFQTRGERPTIADGGGAGEISRYELAVLFTTDARNWTDLKRLIKDQLNVGYIFMDYTLIGKYSAITIIESNGKSAVNFLPFNNQPTNTYNIDNQTVVEYSSLYSPDYVWVPAGNNTVVDSVIYVQTRNNQVTGQAYINDVCTPEGILHFEKKQPELGGCLSFSSYGVYYIPPVAENTIFTRLMFMDAWGLERVNKVFDNGLIKIYELDW